MYTKDQFYYTIARYINTLYLKANLFVTYVNLKGVWLSVLRLDAQENRTPALFRIMLAV